MQSVTRGIHYAIASFSISKMTTSLEPGVQDFIQNHSVGVISTCSGNKPHAVPIYYFYDPEKNHFYFVTKSETKKVLNILENKNTFLTIYKEDPQATFTAECEARLLEHVEPDYTNITNHLINIHSIQDYYPTPLTMLKEGNLTLVELKVLSHTFRSYRQNV